jgi:hypothetical protein
MTTPPRATTNRGDIIDMQCAFLFGVLCDY